MTQCVRRAQKRGGDFSCEISPPLFRFSEIRFGFQITTLVIPESLGTHKQQPVFLPHSSTITLAVRAFPLPSVSSRLDRVSLPILEDVC
jgi:tRNA U34 5-methylaminomethyl-2-thiouridine-forming methyltransferase MnmC